MNITVSIKNVYGNEMIYPVCDRSKLFVDLIGKKTFSKRDIELIKKLGYTISVNQPKEYL